MASLSSAIPSPALHVFRFPDPENFKKWVTDHAKKIIPTVDEQSVEDALSFLTIRDNVTASRPDKRRRSTNFVCMTGMLPSSEAVDKSCSIINEETCGKQGIHGFKKKLGDDYHKLLKQLFSREPDLQAEYDFTSDPYLVRKSDGQKLSTDEFCSVVGALSRRWDDRLRTTEACKSITDTRSHEDDLKFLKLASEIVIKRYQNHNLCDNDLATEQGWKVWRDHVKVLICFTVYCIVVDAYIHKRYGKEKCGFKSEMERRGY